ncbi:DUF2318 domain-containing protein [Anaerosporobacter sp.]|uniref:DUF2318 domain-containing protein n=1 Tax=Anaerosporobacter sp. TaxID=1872529 RepID=UPI00289EE5AC|nr:DUF2318 domain-containing protein [Anaerosporobacter sp.]
MKANNKKIRLLMGAILMTVGIVALTGCSKKANTGASSKDSEETSSGDNLVIPVDKISEKASFYPVEVDGVDLEVVAVKASDGTIRTAFNTCQICYGSGRGYYKQNGDVLICQNCGNQFAMDHVEVESGGCNPWPIFDKDKTVDDDNITISYDFLKESTGIFANWKVEY